MGSGWLVCLQSVVGTCGCSCTANHGVSRGALAINEETENGLAPSIEKMLENPELLLQNERKELLEAFRHHLSEWPPSFWHPLDSKSLARA